MLINPIKKTFPGIEAVLSNNFIEVMDKNKLPLASIQTSLNLNSTTTPENTMTDPHQHETKPFLFLLQGVPLSQQTELLQDHIVRELGF